MRNFVVLLDGTWLSASSGYVRESRSNVYNLNLYIPTRVHLKYHTLEQIIYYQPGIGSATSGLKLLGGTLAWGIERLIEQAYINICSNFDFNTNLYLFGFSRGAVIARALAGLISKCGILQADKIGLYNNIYNIFRKQGKPSEADQKFLNENCLWHPIMFLGVFDTVYGGIHRGPLYKKRLHFASQNLCLPAAVKNAVQILALDEDRYFFRPLPWTGYEATNQNLHQIWMPGVHGDVGGSHADGGMGSAALLTMIRMVQKAPENTLIFSDRFNSYGVNAYNIDDLYREVENFRIGEIVVHKTPIAHSLGLLRHARKTSGDNKFLHPIIRQLVNANISYVGEKKLMRSPYVIDGSTPFIDDVYELPS